MEVVPYTQGASSCSINNDDNAVPGDNYSTRSHSLIFLLLLEVTPQTETGGKNQVEISPALAPRKPEGARPGCERVILTPRTSGPNVLS